MNQYVILFSHLISLEILGDNHYQLKKIFVLYRRAPKFLLHFLILVLNLKCFFHLEMEELGSETVMDTGCAGPGSDTIKVCILYFYGAEISCISLFYTKIFYDFLKNSKFQ